MRVSDEMTRDVRTVTPDQSVCDAAKIMADCDCGCVPVQENDRLVGMLTDRDLAIRALAAGKGPDTKVREVMTPEVLYCFEDQEIEDVAHNMADIRVHRLPVMNRDKRLVGILSLGDIAVRDGPRWAGEALAGLSRPGGPHSQTGAARHAA